MKREKILITNTFNKKEGDYIEKIKILENQIASFDKYDIQHLQKQNKEYEIQIILVNNSIQKLTQKQHFEQGGFNELITDVIVIKDKLVAKTKTK